MFHWNISVAFANVKAEKETYVVFPKDFPDDTCYGYERMHSSVNSFTSQLKGGADTVAFINTTVSVRDPIITYFIK